MIISNEILNQISSTPADRHGAGDRGTECMDNNSPEPEAQGTMMPAVKEGETAPTKKSVERSMRFAELKALRISTKTKLTESKAIISIDGVKVMELEDIAALKAKQKHGKTTVLKVIAGALLKGNLFRLKSELEEAKVLWLDTEQKAADVQLIIRDIKHLTGLSDEYIDKHLYLLQLRKRNHKTLLNDLSDLVSTLRPNVVIIDGIVDFISSFNDEQQSHDLINSLLVLSEEYHCAIINVLHENKRADDNNMRGHLGTMMSQKAGTVLACKKADGIITVISSDPRHQEMPSWNIMYDDYGHIVSADQCGSQTDAKKRQRMETIKAVILEKGGTISRKELTEKLQAEFSLARTTVTNMISKEIGKTLSEDGDNIQLLPELPFDPA